MSSRDTSVFDIDARLLSELPLPMPKGDTDKESRGRAVVIGGGAGAPGAVILSGLGALRAGAGKVQLGVPRSLMANVGTVFLEAGIAGFAQGEEGEPAATAWQDMRSLSLQADSVLVGPGLMDEAGAHALTLGLLENAIGPLYILDALALCGLNQASDLLARHEGRVILTPHAGEMARLTGQTKEHINANPVPVALTTAQKLHCIVVLKGVDTHIATPVGQVFRHRGGVAGLATAGSGDVLAGMIAGLGARGASAMQASMWGVFVHGQAGARLSSRIGPLGFIAREILDEVPALLAEHAPAR